MVLREANELSSKLAEKMNHYHELVTQEAQAAANAVTDSPNGRALLSAFCDGRKEAPVVGKKPECHAAKIASDCDNYYAIKNKDQKNYKCGWKNSVCVRVNQLCPTGTPSPPPPAAPSLKPSPPPPATPSPPSPPTAPSPSEAAPLDHSQKYRKERQERVKTYHDKWKTDARWKKDKMTWMRSAAEYQIDKYFKEGDNVILDQCKAHFKATGGEHTAWHMNGGKLDRPCSQVCKGDAECTQCSSGGYGDPARKNFTAVAPWAMSPSSKAPEDYRCDAIFSGFPPPCIAVTRACVVIGNRCL